MNGKTKKQEGTIKADRIFFFVSLIFCGLVPCFLSGCSPNPVDKLLQSGAQFEENNQFAQALAEYNKALEIDPQNADVYFNRASVYQKQGNTQAALADYKKIIEINPNFSQPHVALGQIYEDEGRPDKALAEYSKALELNPNYGAAYSRRAALYFTKGEYKKALEDAKYARIKGVAVSDEFMKQLEDEAARQR